MKRKDGTPLKRAAAAADRGRTGRSHGDPTLIVFVEDVTEKRVLEQQLHMGVKMKRWGGFPEGSRTISNNLLGVIIGYARS